VVPVFDQRSLVNMKQKGHNAMVDEGESHSIIQFEGVGLRCGNGPEILSDITFVLNRRSFHFLTGPSGAGKTLLLRLMYLATRPTRSLVTLFGRDVSSLRRRQLAKLRREIGLIFQDFRLLAHLSVFDNVALPLRITATPEENHRHTRGRGAPLRS
jgi:cell division transport system ATP-binding protein